MSLLIYSLTIGDSVYEMIDYDRPVWTKPSGSGIKVIPFDPNTLIESAIAIYAIDELDFSSQFKLKVKKVINESIEVHHNSTLIQLDNSKYSNLKMEMKKEFELLKPDNNLRMNIISHNGDEYINEISKSNLFKFETCNSVCQNIHQLFPIQS